MNGSRIFVDTNICIYLLNGDELIADLLNDASVSFHLLLKLIYSYHGNNSVAIKTLDAFIQSVTVLGMDDIIKHNTIEIRKLKRLKIPDAIIAASALSNKLSLVTADKALLKIEELKVVSYAPKNS